MLKVGADVGGTFTDVLIWDSSGLMDIFIAKVPTTPDPSEGVLQGIRQALDGVHFEEFPGLAVNHGTTVGTNALIQRAGVKTGLITTKGFRDVLEIGRTKREVMYDLLWGRPDPLVRRRYRCEVTERVAADGSEVVPLNLVELESAFEFLMSEGVESVAICFINAHANGEHERLAAQHLQRVYTGPDGKSPRISCSSDVIPVLHEFERTNLTVINAYIAPLLERYLEDLQAKLSEMGARTPLNVMHSSGGLASLKRAESAPVRLLLSGPAAGVVGATYIAQRAGLERVVTFDMGGTSCDVCLVEDGVAHLTTLNSVGGVNLELLPMLYISTVGAGGGSIARIDEGGMLKVGPESAGATPGPACYGRGGTAPTVTDAWLCCGLLASSVDGHDKGVLNLDAELAESALQPLAAAVASDVKSIAEGVLRVVESNMINAVKSVTVKRGRDPRDLSLVAYGGAGPLVAAKVAEDLEMKGVLVPRHPGLTCALGTLVAPIMYDVMQTFRRPLTGASAEEANAKLSAITDLLMQKFENPATESIVLHREAFLRYVGQSHSLATSIEAGALDEETLEKLRARFDDLFQMEFGYNRPDQPVEFDRLRVSARSDPESFPHFGISCVGNYATETLRCVWIGGRSIDVPVVLWERLYEGAVLTGPVIVEEYDTTVWIPPSWRGAVLDDGSILMSHGIRDGEK